MKAIASEWAFLEYLQCDDGVQVLRAFVVSVHLACYIGYILPGGRCISGY